MLAVISLGTNTSRLLVVDVRPDGTLAVVDHRQTGTRLGEGLREAGALLPAAMERTLAAAREFADVARGYGAPLWSIATSAARRAANADVFAGRMQQITGVPLEILEGRLEAEASFRGATYGAPGRGRVGVLDIGGGSTECAAGRRRVLDAARSLEIGSVRVGERFPGLMGDAPGRPAHAAAAEARAEIARTLAPLASLRPLDELRCVAGTPMTLAAIAFDSHVDAVAGRMLSRDVVDATVARLLELPLAARRSLPGMLPQRADIVAGGGLILSEAMRLLGVCDALLEANDLLLGFLLLQVEMARSTRTE